jgi:hypothetical protein
MTERRQVRDTFAQRELERRDRGELTAKAEHLDRFVPRAIDDMVARAEAICERRGCGRRDGCECWIHNGA